MLLQGAEGRDAELAFILKFDAFQFSVFVRFLFFDLSKKHLKIGQQRIICINLLSLRVPFPSMSLAFDHTEDQKRSAVSLGFISLVKEFILYVGPIRIIFMDQQTVCDGLSLRFFFVTDLESDRIIASLRTDTFESPPSSGVACLFDTPFQAFRKKPERIEQTALANPVFADHRGDRGQGLGLPHER